LHRAEMAERVNLADPAAQAWMEQSQAQGSSATQAMASLSRILDQQAQTLAVTEVFLGAALVFLALIALLWTLRWSPMLTRSS